jgi:UDP-N-acetylglucosamine 3-dehydrogenase
MRAALVGIGSMGANHARILQKLPDVELVAVVDPAGDPNRILSDVRVLSDVSELVSESIDYCVVASPTVSHRDNAILLLNEGISVLVEKPIAISVQEARDLVVAAKKHNVIGGVGHIERYNAALQEARKRILKGDLGEIFQITTSRQGPFPGRIADVGVIKDLATHDIDLTSWLCGQAYTQIATFAAHRSGRQHEDLVSCSGLLGNSIVVNHVVNWLSPLKERRVTIVGEKGTFIVDTLNSDLTIYKNGEFEIHHKEIAHFKGVKQGDIYKPAFEREEPLLSEHKAFRDRVRGFDSEIVTFESGLQTLEVAEAMIESMKSGKVVSL